MGGANRNFGLSRPSGAGEEQAVQTSLPIGHEGVPIFLRPPPDGDDIHDQLARIVVPFANLAVGSNAELYGLTEELLTALPCFKQIKVFGRETSKSLPSVVGSKKIREEITLSGKLKVFPVAAAVVLCGLDVTEQLSIPVVSGIVSPAKARIGRPLTPTACRGSRAEPSGGALWASSVAEHNRVDTFDMRAISGWL
jgi:hypothetical protein